MLNKAQKEVQNEIFMGVSIALLLVFTAVAIVAVCFYIAKSTSPNTVNAKTDSRFETIETRMITASVSYTIVYDKQTKVIYSIDSTGKFTPLINEDGDPLIYKGE